MSNTTRTFKILAAGVLIGGFAIAGTAVAGGRGHSCHDNMTAEAATERAQRAADHVLDEVDATETQRDAIDAILADTAPQLVALHAEGAPLREKAAEALSRADRAGLEAARRSALALVERASAEVVDAALDIAEVLQPEQRETLYGLYQDHAAEKGKKGTK